MIEISEGAGGVVAADVRDTLRAFDQAVLSAARMCASFIEMVDGAGVPMRQSQSTLQSMTTGMSSAVGARGDIVDAVRHMLVIKKNSTVAWSDFGCPTGMDERAPVAVRADEPTRTSIRVDAHA